MDANFVIQYFTQDLSIEEKESYINYIKGYESDDIWMEKALMRREPLLVALENITCGNGSDRVCNAWIDVRENGRCRCSKGHACYDVVLREIEKIMNQ